MQSIPAGTLPLPTANFSHGTRIVIGAGADSSTQYVEEFDDGRLIDVVGIRGFLNLLQTADGKLALRGKSTGDSLAVLIYHFWSPQILTEAVVEASCAAPSFAQEENELAVSVDRRRWKGSRNFGCV